MDQQPPRYGQRAEEPMESAPVCARHPQRTAYVSCARCGRPACPECQVSAPVGIQCVDCVRSANDDARSRGAKVRDRDAIFPRAGVLPVTWSIIAVCAVVFLLQIVLPGQVVVNRLAYNSAWTFDQPWRALTSGVVHGSFMHLAMNMYTLYIFGQALEPRMGSWRFLVVFVLSVLGGSAAVFFLAPGTWVVGASGGIFGLFGAFFAWTRFRGGDTRGLVTLIVINLLFGFFVSGISWQAHIGGLVTGAVVAVVCDLAARGRRGARR